MSGNRQIAERFIASLEARDWEAWAALLHPDVIYEIPQSRERIRGRDRYLRFNQEYPGDWHLRPKVVIADEQHASGVSTITPTTPWRSSSSPTGWSPGSRTSGPSPSNRQPGVST
jgi:hypothetical protein